MPTISRPAFQWDHDIQSKCNTSLRTNNNWFLHFPTGKLLCSWINIIFSLMIKSSGRNDYPRVNNKNPPLKTPSGGQILELRCALISFIFPSSINVGVFLLVFKIPINVSVFLLFLGILSLPKFSPAALILPLQIPIWYPRNSKIFAPAAQFTISIILRALEVDKSCSRRRRRKCG